MKRILFAALLAGAAAGVAAAQTAPAPAGSAANLTEAINTGAATTGAVVSGTVTDLRSGQVTVVYDQSLTEEFRVSRAIVDRIKAEFGESAVYDNGQDLPEELDAMLEPGNVLPDSVEVSAVPDKLGDLPTLGTGTRWVAVGENLVEVDSDNRIVMVLHDALP